MMYIIKTINGQKVAVPLTADTGSGNPVGTIIAQYKKTNMAGYLYLDGRDTTGTADELQTVYPALYAYLGNSNILPDYREFALVGAEENTTSSNIATHDTFTQGQEKDDQVQNHRHKWQTGSASIDDGVEQFTVKKTVGWNNYTQIANGTGDTGSSVRIGGVMSGRFGDVTRGKRKAVYFYIKATSGLTESQMDSMITILNQQRSYSETETDTGKKWIDGKTIYAKTYVLGTAFYVPDNAFSNTSIPNPFWINSTQGIDTVTKIELQMKGGGTINYYGTIQYNLNSSVEFINVKSPSLGFTLQAGSSFTIEYTKSS